MLPSFNVTAITLSFLALRDEVQSLMNLLSQVTKHYFEIHCGILEGFIVDRPKIVCELDFGNTDLNLDSTDLDQQKLKSLPRYKRNKLTEFRFKYM